jgi:hypothetical protein
MIDSIRQTSGLAAATLPRPHPTQRSADTNPLEEIHREQDPHYLCLAIPTSGGRHDPYTRLGPHRGRRRLRRVFMSNSPIEGGG